MFGDNMSHEACDTVVEGTVEIFPKHAQARMRPTIIKKNLPWVLECVIILKGQFSLYLNNYVKCYSIWILVKYEFGFLDLEEV